MAQISRPFQVALALAALLLAVWFIALRSHGSSSGSGSSSPPAAQTSSSSSSSSSHSSSPGSPSSVYHGPAPGVEGLTRAIAKAHGAVATSEQNAKQLEHRSDEASSSSSTAASPSASAPQATRAHTHTGAGSAATSKHASGAPTHASGAPSRQAAVESALHKGKIAVILFWNPHGADDVLVHRELGVLVRAHHDAAKAKAREVRHADRIFGLELDKQLAVFQSPASAVATYGSITRGIQVYSTPTLVVVNRHGAASVLTGFADAYTIEQAIEETRHA